jgi:hypothetical protein
MGVVRRGREGSDGVVEGVGGEIVVLGAEAEVKTGGGVEVRRVSVGRSGGCEEDSTTTVGLGAATVLESELREGLAMELVGAGGIKGVREGAGT